MLEHFSVKISDFNTAWLWKCFVVNFVDFGVIWGVALACGIPAPDIAIQVNQHPTQHELPRNLKVYASIFFEGFNLASRKCHGASPIVGQWSPTLTEFCVAWGMTQLGPFAIYISARSTWNHPHFLWVHLNDKNEQTRGVFTHKIGRRRWLTN